MKKLWSAISIYEINVNAFGLDNRQLNLVEIGTSQLQVTSDFAHGGYSLRIMVE